MEEVNNLVAECDLHPYRLRELLAELIRRRVFDAAAARFRLSPKLRTIYEENVPPRASTRDWFEAGAEEAIEQAIHMPDPVRPARAPGFLSGSILRNMAPLTPDQILCPKCGGDMPTGHCCWENCTC